MNFRLLFALVCFGGLVEGMQAAENLVFRPAFKTADLRMPVGLVRHDHRYYIVDEYANETVVLDEGGDLVARFGSIGSRLGDLFRPTGIRVTGEGLLWIYDFGNSRLQSFDSQGLPQSQVRIPDSQGWCVLSKDEVVLARIEDGGLLSVYGSQGQLLKTMGKVRSFGQFYEGASWGQRRRFRSLINAALLACDAERNVYLLFRFAPIVVKFDKGGQKVWEVRLQGGLMDKLSIRFKDEAPGARNFIRTQLNGQVANLVTLGIAVDRLTERLYVLTPGFSILELDSEDGETLRRFTPTRADEGSKFTPFSLPSVDRKRVTVIDIFSATIYQADLPAQAEDSDQATDGPARALREIMAVPRGQAPSGRDNTVSAHQPTVLRYQKGDPQ